MVKLLMCGMTVKQVKHLYHTKITLELLIQETLKHYLTNLDKFGIVRGN